MQNPLSLNKITIQLSHVHKLLCTRKTCLEPFSSKGEVVQVPVTEIGNKNTENQGQDGEYKVFASIKWGFSEKFHKQW